MSDSSSDKSLSASDSPAASPPMRLRRSRWLPVAVTLAVAAAATVLAYAMWNTYLGTPWTRDGRVRVYVVSLAPEVAGRVVSLPVADNQYVHKGDVLMSIDKRDYEIALKLAQAAADQAKADAQNKQSQAQRRLALTDLATTPEEKEAYASAAAAAEANYQQELANVDKAQLNLERTEIHSPVNGWITNLQARVGDYAMTGSRSLSIVDADSFWVDGYFEETKLGSIHENDRVRVYLLGYRSVVEGHVEGIARGIVVSNATPGTSGLADVNPIFTWVRLAQRVPVRVHLDRVPADVRLVAGMTATVEVDGGGDGKPLEATGSGSP